MASFNATVDSYRASLAEVEAGRLKLINENLDLGTPADGGNYDGTSLTYEKLVDDLARHKFVGLSPELRANILDYYAKRKPPAAPATKKALAESAKLNEKLAMLRQSQ
jgi:hypothetical protein